jgi:hypothetical protein
MRNIIDNYRCWNLFNKGVAASCSDAPQCPSIPMSHHFVGGYVADILENLEIEGFCCIFVVGISEIVIKPYM